MTDSLDTAVAGRGTRIRSRLGDLAVPKLEFDTECRRQIDLRCKQVLPRCAWCDPCDSCDSCDTRKRLMAGLYAVADGHGWTRDGVWQWPNAPTTYLPQHRKPIEYAYSDPDLVMRTAHDS